MTFVDRCYAYLARTDDTSARARSFQVVLIGTLAVDQAASARMAGAAVAIVLMAASLHPKSSRLAGAGGLLLSLSLVLSTFPTTANHAFLQCIACFLLVWLGSGDETDRHTLLAGLRAVCVTMIFTTGLQKALYGNYFDGRMLAVLISQHERYRTVFSLLLSDADLTRLAGYDLHRIGDGPYLVDSWLLVVASNMVWVAELLLPVALVRVRAMWPVVATVVLFVCIEVGAREGAFGLVAVNLVLLFAQRDLHTRLLPLWMLVVVAMSAVASGLTGSRDLLVPM